MTDTKPLDPLDFTLLQQLTQTFGPSGQEHNVAALILDQTKIMRIPLIRIHWVI